MRIIIPLVLFVMFIVYVLYLAFIKKEAKQHLHTVIYPGIFFFGIWAAIFYFFF